jgi:hypothetical protein
MFTAKGTLMRFVLGVAVATAGVPALAATQQDTTSQTAPAAATPSIQKASYNHDKGMLVIVGTGFDQTASVRLNGVELTGEKKFKAEKNKLRVSLPASAAQLKAKGQNRVEIVQAGTTSGEFDF